VRAAGKPLVKDVRQPALITDPSHGVAASGPDPGGSCLLRRRNGYAQLGSVRVPRKL